MAITLKQLIEGDDLIRVFALGRIIHPIFVEMFGLAGGYHGFWIDQEHASVSTDALVSVTIAARANNMDSFVRIPPTGYWEVTQCLEAGAGGVMAAQIHTADEAEEFVRWTKFAPRGCRGLNVSGRDGNYAHMPVADFVEKANRENFVAIQVETLGAVEQADEIAAIDGVDLLFIGPSDLSLALGVPGQFHSAKVWEAIDKVAAACRNHGKTWGAVTPDPEFADRAVANGCRMPTLGNDVHIMRRGIEAFQTSFGGLF